jgi:uncharacterized membrane protein YdjX (TVP38/TMEM64 family)
LARFWPLAALLVVAVVAYSAGLHRQLSVAWLVEQQHALRQAVAAHPVLAPLAYILLYTVAVACAVPGGLVFSTAAGLMFGTVLGGAYAVIAITLGSAILFLAARSALRPLAERLARRMLGRDLPALEGDGFLYMLAVRLVPFTPFWVVNLAAAMTRIRLGAYVAATFIGIAPITYILAAAGAGIGDTLAAGEQPGLGTILRPHIMLPLLLLAIVSLAPIAFKRRQRRRSLAAAATRSRAT